jgi:hypothetical protein
MLTSSLLDFEKDFEEGRALDINMNLSAKELSSVRYQEKADYDSLALYVEVSFLCVDGFHFILKCRRNILR